MNNIKYATAIWENLKAIPKKSALDELHISCGVETEESEEQYIGYFAEDEGAKITIEQTGDTWKLTFKAPSQGLENEEGYWLSPSLINDKIEASEFFIQ